MANLICIGELMQNYIETNNLSKQPRKLLVGGLRAEKILLTSPLVKWYLEHGLCISRIYQTIEFGKAVAFDGFTNLVTQGRREGKATGSKMRADTFKLLG